MCIKVVTFEEIVGILGIITEGNLEMVKKHPKYNLPNEKAPIIAKKGLFQ